MEVKAIDIKTPASDKIQIVFPGPGIHNEDDGTVDRLIKANSYRDCSTICLIPTRGMIPIEVVMSWFGLMPGMNQRFLRLPVKGAEVGKAYSETIQLILDHPDLSKFRFLLTLEEDNMPPADGLVKLHAAMWDGPYAAVGGLYWTKGEGGQPMIYGDPKNPVINFIPQIPEPDTVQECNGLGMGFTLFDMNIFRDKRIPKPWFETKSEVFNGGARAYTQDLWFFENIRKLGYRVACHTGVRVGHFDVTTGMTW